jgi:ribosomal protein S18 acetylase RimI-like enzyme
MSTVFREWKSGDEAVCEVILRSVPDWFGIEEALVKYVEETAKYPTSLAMVDGVEVGFISLHLHFPRAAEVHCMAIRPEFHRRGIGRAMIQFAERELAAKRVEYLQVKTLGPSRPSEFYEQTRRFYEAVGFVPVEEFPTLWGRNPCLQLVKRIGA